MPFYSKRKSQRTTQGIKNEKTCNRAIWTTRTPGILATKNLCVWYCDIVSVSFIHWSFLLNVPVDSSFILSETVQHIMQLLTDLSCSSIGRYLLTTLSCSPNQVDIHIGNPYLSSETVRYTYGEPLLLHERGHIYWQPFISSKRDKPMYSP